MPILLQVDNVGLTNILFAWFHPCIFDIVLTICSRFMTPHDVVVGLVTYIVSKRLCIQICTKHKPLHTMWAFIHANVVLFRRVEKHQIDDKFPFSYCVACTYVWYPGRELYSDLFACRTNWGCEPQTTWFVWFRVQALKDMNQAPDGMINGVKCTA